MLQIQDESVLPCPLSLHLRYLTKRCSIWEKAPPLVAHLYLYHNMRNNKTNLYINYQSLSLTSGKPQSHCSPVSIIPLPHVDCLPWTTSFETVWFWRHFNSGCATLCINASTLQLLNNFTPLERLKLNYILQISGTKSLSN